MTRRESSKRRGWAEVFKISQGKIGELLGSIDYTVVRMLRCRLKAKIAESHPCSGASFVLFCKQRGFHPGKLFAFSGTDVW